MAENTAANVEVAVTGHVYFAPTGTTLPINAIAALNVAFVNVGYLSDDAIDEEQSRDTSDIVAWGGALVRTLQTKYGLKYTFAMLESTDANLVHFYGSAAEITGAVLPHKIMVIEWEDGTKVFRNVYPDAQITETGTRKFASTDATSLSVTVTCYEDTSGKHGYMYRDSDGVS